MTIKQISVFLENKSGRLNEVARVLAANQINMLAFSYCGNDRFRSDAPDREGGG